VKEDFGVKQVADYEDIRKTLVKLISEEKYYVSIDPERPCKWWHGKVIDPRSGLFFTHLGSWDFILELLKNKHQIETIILKYPPGETGYVLKYGSNPQKIYIKLELGKNAVIGRSFHY
jgi:hypothetical protein